MRERKDCENLPNSVRYSADIDKHFPHFCTVFFHFFSVVVSPYSQSKYCGSTIKHLILDDNTKFWRGMCICIHIYT